MLNFWNFKEFYISLQKRQLVVINASEEDKQDLIKDLCSIIYSFCARLYGLRRARGKAMEVKQIVKQD